MNCDLENSFLLVYLSGPLIITHGPRGATPGWPPPPPLFSGPDQSIYYIVHNFLKSEEDCMHEDFLSWHWHQLGIRVFQEIAQSRNSNSNVLKFHCSMPLVFLFKNNMVVRHFFTRTHDPDSVSTSPCSCSFSNAVCLVEMQQMQLL